MSEPPRVIPLEYATPALDPDRRWRNVARWSLGLGWVCCIIAWLAVMVVTESVVITGWFVAVLGILAIICGIRLRSPLVTSVGIAHCGICILFLGLVNVLRWSPREAKWPFIIMGTIYCIVSAGPTFFAMSHCQTRAS